MPRKYTNIEGGVGAVSEADSITMFDPDEIEFGMVLEEDESTNQFVPRLRNYGRRQHRQFTGYDRNLPMVVYGDRKETVHGTNSTGTKPMTVIVFRWGLQQRKPGHRFKSATLRVVFSTLRRKHGYEDGGDDDDDNEDEKGGKRKASDDDNDDNGSDNDALVDHYYDPNVVSVAPSGTFALEPTITDVIVARKRNVEGTAEMGVGVGPATAQLGGRIAYELSTTVTASDCVTINGFQRLDMSQLGMLAAVRDPDRCNAAEWQLFENSATRSGLPTQFHTAVRLERRPNDRSEFTATFTIETHVDSLTDKLTALKRFVGRVPRDDPIIFNPDIEEEGPLAAWKDKLDERNLFDDCKMVMYQTMASSQ